MLKVLVTGAAGNLGQATCRTLIESGDFEVRGTDRKRIMTSVVPLQVVDLLDREACYGLTEGMDAIVHLGNHITPYHIDAQTIFAENNAMNVNIFQAGLESGIRQFVFASSVQAIHGTRRFKSGGEQEPSRLPYLPLDGEVPPAPGNTYGASKVCGEALLGMYVRTYGISAAAIRFPMLLSQKNMQDVRRNGRQNIHYHPWLDEGFACMSPDDASRLIMAILRRPPAGMDICQAGGMNMFLDQPVSEVLDTVYPGVPLRRPVEQLRTLVDLDVLRERYGWEPVDDLHAPEPVTASA